MKRGYRLSALATGAALGLAMTAAPASAVDFQFGESNLAIDSIASIGMGVRASGQDCMYISVQNGGCPDGIGQSANVNTDDGNINFDQWDMTSASVKIVSDIEFTYKNFGAFTRVKAFYDYVITERAGREGGGDYALRPISDSLRGDDAENAGRSIDLLDAFVYGNFDIGNVPTTLRVGKQVINWGESLVIQGGINQFNAIDVAAIRTPGAELKEALLPEESVYASFLLPLDMSLEAFYAFNWRKTELDSVGTFFSGADIFGPGGAYVMVGNDGPGFPETTIGIVEGDEPDDQGQWGVKLGHYAGWLNQGTELGLYYVNYHSKLPYLEYSNGMPLGVQANFGLPLGTLPEQNYRAAYPEDIEYIGGSFATTIAGTAVSGELLYSWNMPLQISSGELLGAHWFTNFAGAPVAVLPYDQTPGAFPKGYFRDEVINGQISTITTFNPSDNIPRLVDADSAALIFNVGFQHIPGLSEEEESVLSGGRGSEISHPNRAIMHNNAGPVGPVFNPAQPLVKADTTSWGYRTILNFTYNNAFNTPWSITPGIQWAQDFGTSAGTIGPGFLDNKKTISVGVTADLQSVWKAQVQYTNSFGNSFQNYTQDRDFITASVSYAF